MPQGSLSDRSLAALLVEARESTLTGTLRVEGAGAAGWLFLESGDLVGARLSRGFKPLSETLLEHGLVTRDELARALPALIEGVALDAALPNVLGPSRAIEALDKAISLELRRAFVALAASAGDYWFRPGPSAIPYRRARDNARRDATPTPTPPTPTTPTPTPTPTPTATPPAPRKITPGTFIEGAWLEELEDVFAEGSNDPLDQALAVDESPLIAAMASARAAERLGELAMQRSAYDEAAQLFGRAYGLSGEARYLAKQAWATYHAPGGKERLAEILSMLEEASFRDPTCERAAVYRNAILGASRPRA